MVDHLSTQQFPVSIQTLHKAKRRDLQKVHAELNEQGHSETAPIRGVVDHPGYEVAVARRGGRIVGAVAYDHGDQRYKNERTHVQDLRVTEEGHGVGYALMSHVARTAKYQTKNRRVTITNAVPDAREFYRHISGKTPYYEHSVDNQGKPRPEYAPASWDWKGQDFENLVQGKRAPRRG